MAFKYSCSNFHSIKVDKLKSFSAKIWVSGLGYQGTGPGVRVSGSGFRKWETLGLGFSGRQCEPLNLGQAFRVEEQLLRKNMERFQRGLVFKAHGLLYHPTLGSRVITKNDKVEVLDLKVEAARCHFVEHLPRA